MGRIYLDYAATTPVHPDVVQAMSPYFTDIYGNPSSLHCCGQEAKQAVEGSRSLVAALINAYSDEIIFTSGGTESDNTAITGIAYASKSRGNHIITSSIEHHAVLETCHFLGKSGFAVTYLPVDKYGMVSPDDVKKAITDKTILISIMMANNEVGTIEPISEIGVIAKDGGICFHTDAVQAVGHIPVNVEKLGVDLLSISAHKLYGPKGIGALYIRRGTKIQTYLHGGSQERLLRAGTENVPGIVGFGKAAAIAHKELHAESDRLTVLRDKLIDGLKERVDNLNLNGHPVKRLPGNVNISVAFVEGESMLLSLDLAGICVSTGSACSSSSLEPSHVLMAMGLSAEQAHGSLRFSMGKWTTEDEIEMVLEKVPEIISRLRAMSPLSNIQR
jgi:cysteine desulfurase